MTEEEVKTKLNEVETKVFSPLKSSILTNKRRGTYTDLLDSVESVKVDVKKKGREFSFDSPIFVTSIFFTSKGEDAPELKVTYKDIQSNVHTVLRSNKTSASNCLEVSISNVITSFEVSPEGILNRTEVLSEVAVIGVKLSQLSNKITAINKKHEYLTELKKDAKDILIRVETEKQEVLDKSKEYSEIVQSQKAQLEADANKIVELQSKIDELEDAFSEKEAEVEEQNKVLSDIKNTTDSLTKKEETLNNSISQLTAQRDGLNTEIASADSRLKKLKDDINMYSENISDYFKESRNQTFLYTFLLTVALIALGTLGYELVIKINDLIEYYIGLNTITQGKTKAFEFLLLRAPMALVISFFIYLFSNVITKLVQKIIHINDVKKEMIASSIIAREIVESSAHELELSPDKVYGLKESLKLDFLSHTMFATHAKSAKEARERRSGLLSKAKVKITEKLTGASVEAEVDNTGE